MGGNIPRPIKSKVIRKWLDGLNREQIAREEEISTGTVSNIIKECRQNDSEFDLMRQVAVKLKNEEDSIESFAPLVRLREILRRELSLSLSLLDKKTIGEEEDQDAKTQQVRDEEPELEEKLESLLHGLVVFCFKQNLSIKDFVNVIHEICSTANKLGIPLDNLPSYVKELESNSHKLAEEIEEKRLEMQEALEDYDVTVELLEEYDANRPLFETNKKLREELAKVTKQRDDYNLQLAKEKSDRELEDYNTWAMSEAELEEANEMLGFRVYPGRLKLGVEELKKIALAIYHQPTKYIDVIRQYIKDRPELAN